jgi:hypothetical protein
LPNLELKTLPKQLLVYLLLAFAQTDFTLKDEEWTKKVYQFENIQQDI